MSPARSIKESETPLREAELLCAQRGVALTQLRRQVLEIVARANGPIGAYSIVTELARERGRSIGPTTVYRTLDLLVEIGCVIKIESRNTFALCHAPGHHHHGMMLICKSCGKTDEVESPKLDDLLRKAAASSGFHPERQVIEIEGTCGSCWDRT